MATAAGSIGRPVAPRPHGGYGGVVWRALVMGMRDAGSPLHRLNIRLLQRVYCALMRCWQEHILRGRRGCHLVATADRSHAVWTADPGTIWRSHKWAPVERFPSPTNLCVNMMPFVLGEPDSLPMYCRGYWDLIQACCIPESESPRRPEPRRGIPARLGRVCYLTVHESFVEAGSSQRRLGLHIESPGTAHGVAQWEPTNPHPFGEPCSDRAVWGAGIFVHTPEPVDDADARFRSGVFGWSYDAGDPEVPTAALLQGGLYMASTVSNTCQLWDVEVDEPAAVAGELGSCEHLRPVLGEPVPMLANQLYWITDRTPHEALPQPCSGYRQFFRLVTSALSVWYARHSDSNPLGVEPGVGTTVLTHNKFDQAATAAAAASAPSPSCGIDLEAALRRAFETGPTMLAVARRLRPAMTQAEAEAWECKMVDAHSTANKGRKFSVDADMFVEYCSRLVGAWPVEQRERVLRQLCRRS